MADTPQVPAQVGQTPPSGDPAKELSDYKQFFEGVTPLLEKLNASPDLVQAILSDKVTDEFAKAALAGKLSIAEAEAATAAVKQVEKEIGTKAFNTADPDEISKLVEEKVNALKTELTEKDDMRQFEQYTNEFISSTPDFSKYSAAISEWLDNHDITDVSVAYFAVKGELSVKEAKQAADDAAAENAKNVMLTAGGGNIPANAQVNGQSLVDSLIANRANANRL